MEISALVVVASGENGIISVAQEGKLIRHWTEATAQIPMAVYAPDQAQRGINRLRKVAP